MYINAEGLIGKTNAFFNELNENNPDVFCISETWHIKSFTNFFFAQYQIVDQFAHRKSDKGRYMSGMIIGIKNNIDFSILQQQEDFIIIQVQDFILTFVNIPPESTEKLKYMFETIKLINSDRNKKLIIMGDLNARIGRLIPTT